MRIKCSMLKYPNLQLYLGRLLHLALPEPLILMKGLAQGLSLTLISGHRLVMVFGLRLGQKLCSPKSDDRSSEICRAYYAKNEANFWLQIAAVTWAGRGHENGSGTGTEGRRRCWVETKVI